MSRKKSRQSPAKLPQLAETWHVLIQKLRVWISPPDETPSRPFVIIILNLMRGLILKAEIVEDYPQPKQLQVLLVSTMQAPDQKIQKPHRPRLIQVEDAALADTLAPMMRNIGVEVKQQPRPEGVDEMIEELESHVRGGPEHPGLLSVRGVTPELVGDLFAAAAAFYRAAPWLQLTDQDVLSLRVAPEKKARFTVVMGNAGIEYGLAMYRRWEDLERLFGFADNPLELIPADGGHSLGFEHLSHIPFDDLEAIEQYGWEVADEQAYPLPIVYSPGGGLERPSRADLLWYEAALRVIPILLRDHLQADDGADARPLELTLTVPTHAGETEVEVKYPAGELPKETRPVDMSTWSDLDEEEDDFPAFDRRGMEGMMAAFGTGFDDPDLDEAQQVMYEAWEESNPARRIILAHEALSISADCTDAYVLLAEEEADTVARALEYYEQGVAAGERALGQAYFEENVGHFWGLLETRPYMRARQGLANILWQLERTNEAAEHYRDMLRLNPGDNQGIRYTLLNLLLSINDDAGARALIADYEEDGMAEWLYTRALLAFRKSGAGRAANKALKEATEMNPHVPTYLTGRKRIPAHLPPYIGWGDENEAAVYASAYLPHWRRTSGAIEWLKDQLKSSTGKRRRGGRTKGK